MDEPVRVPGGPVGIHTVGDPVNLMMGFAGLAHRLPLQCPPVQQHSPLADTITACFNRSVKSHKMTLADQNKPAEYGVLL